MPPSRGWAACVCVLACWSSSTATGYTARPGELSSELREGLALIQLKRAGGGFVELPPHRLPVGTVEYRSVPNANAKECAAACNTDSRCEGYKHTASKKNCWLLAPAAASRPTALEDNVSTKDVLEEAAKIVADGSVQRTEKLQQREEHHHEGEEVKEIKVKTGQTAQAAIVSIKAEAELMEAQQQVTIARERFSEVAQKKKSSQTEKMAEEETKNNDWECHNGKHGGARGLSDSGSHQDWTDCSNFGYGNMDACKDRCSKVSACKFANYDPQQSRCNKNGYCYITDAGDVNSWTSSGAVCVKPTEPTPAPTPPKYEKGWHPEGATCSEHSDCEHLLCDPETKKCLSCQTSSSYTYGTCYKHVSAGMYKDYGSCVIKAPGGIIPAKDTQCHRCKTNEGSADGRGKCFPNPYSMGYQCGGSKPSTTPEISDVVGTFTRNLNQVTGDCSFSAMKRVKTALFGFFQYSDTCYPVSPNKKIFDESVAQSEKNNTGGFSRTDCEIIKSISCNATQLGEWQKIEVTSGEFSYHSFPKKQKCTSKKRCFCKSDTEYPHRPNGVKQGLRNTKVQCRGELATLCGLH